MRGSFSPACQSFSFCSPALLVSGLGGEWPAMRKPASVAPVIPRDLEEGVRQLEIIPRILLWILRQNDESSDSILVVCSGHGRSKVSE